MPDAVDQAALARAREARERRQQQEQARQRAAELERQRTAEAQARREAELARAREAQDQARRDAAAAPQAPNAAAPAQETAPAQRSVEERCAGSSNLVSRELCYVRQCRKPELARDPICVRFREMEEARRRQTEMGQ